MLGSPSRRSGAGATSSSSFLSRHGHSSLSLSRNQEAQATPSSHMEQTAALAASLGSGERAPAIDTVDPDAVIGSIRFVPHVEFSSRMSLNFEPMERKVVDSTHMKIGRYNEKSQNRTAVTFKSKVVSRMHAEVWCQDGAWYIKDAKSSSGTFVNHIRLSPPGKESKPTMLADGDSIQFGIDFRGGTEEVYRCVRTKVEVNRVFQRSNEKFNKEAHRKLKSLTMTGPQTPSIDVALSKTGDTADDRASTYTAECCICLFAIAPSQALFVAPCSHPYHFKCIRPLLMQHYPNFLCCICRKYADLEASVEVESEAWIESQAKDKDPRTPTTEQEEPIFSPITTVVTHEMSSTNVPEETTTETTTSGLGSANMPSAALPTRLFQDLTLERQVTPRNEQGPYLFEPPAA